MTLIKYVQVGRVAYVAYGPDQGKLVAVVDLIDANRVLAEGPAVRRQALNLKTLYLTKFLVSIPHSARQSTLLKAWKKADIDAKWAASNWAKRVAARQVRDNLGDLDRFKLKLAKQARSHLITLEAGKLRLKLKKARAEKKGAGKTAKKPAAKKPAAAAAAKTGKK